MKYTTWSFAIYYCWSLRFCCKPGINTSRASGRCGYNFCGSSVWNFLLLTLLAPRIWGVSSRFFGKFVHRSCERCRFLFSSVALQTKSGLHSVCRSIFQVSLSHTIKRASARTHSRNPLYEWSARRRGRYLHNTKSLIFTPSTEFKP